MAVYCVHKNTVNMFPLDKISPLNTVQYKHFTSRDFQSTAVYFWNFQNIKSVTAECKSKRLNGYQVVFIIIEWTLQTQQMQINAVSGTDVTANFAPVYRLKAFWVTFIIPTYCKIILL